MILFLLLSMSLKLLLGSDLPLRFRGFEYSLIPVLVCDEAFFFSLFSYCNSNVRCTHADRREGGQVNYISLITGAACNQRVH